MASNGFEFNPVKECELCAGSDFHAVKGTSWKGTAFSYSICKSCGLKFMNPRPTPASMTRFFTEEYWQANMSATGFPTVQGYDDKSIDQMKFRMPKYQKAYERVRRHVLEERTLDAKTRFLEVGCAFGYTLEWLNRDHGCQVFGIEPSTEAIERCRQAPAIQIVGATAEEAFLPEVTADEPRYDVILFRHALETLLTPRRILEGVRKRLTNDGLLVVYTPNVEYYDLMSPFTPFVYSPETITRLMALCGLDAYRIVAPESPKTREAALRAAPSREIAVFARPRSRSVPRPAADVHEIIRTIDLGNAARTWSEVSARELVVLLKNRVARRLGR
jgi:2-polyprenyl-3-methyl-5-hydroxy-6-metoxy-1,4-benzoquinol methylase